MYFKIIIKLLKILIFINLNNRARTQKKSSTIPTLVVDGRAYSTDEDKANLFADVLGETFTENGASTDFDSIISKLIIKEQSRFRNKRETSGNLLFMIQKIQECINK